jgi:hypothetical protein
MSGAHHAEGGVVDEHVRQAVSMARDCASHAADSHEPVMLTPSSKIFSRPAAAAASFRSSTPAHDPSALGAGSGGGIEISSSAPLQSRRQDAARTEDTNPNPLFEQAKGALDLINFWQKLTTPDNHTHTAPPSSANIPKEDTPKFASNLLGQAKGALDHWNLNPWGSGPGAPGTDTNSDKNNQAHQVATYAGTPGYKANGQGVPGCKAGKENRGNAHSGSNDSSSAPQSASQRDGLSSPRNVYYKPPVSAIGASPGGAGFGGKEVGGSRGRRVSADLQQRLQQYHQVPNPRP